MHINKLFFLDRKYAFVIGGAGKIGFPMTQALAEAGAKVCIASRNEKNKMYLLINYSQKD